jgi:hypothetical protein
MSQLDDYRYALLAAFPAVNGEELERVLEAGGSRFSSFIVDHGLGPIWHARTGRAEFRDSRQAAEALYLAQEHALREIDTILVDSGIDYAVTKGAATRLFLYDNPAIRACHDIDIVVRPQQKRQAAASLVEAGFKPVADPLIISHELTLSRGAVDVDLHWGLLREGRLRKPDICGIVDRRRKVEGVWMLSAEDELFVMLVHPAFTKHLAGWEMGLHRVADLITWLETQCADWQAVRLNLEQQGVKTAAWATLRWAGLMTGQRILGSLRSIEADICPGRLRARWLSYWLENDLSHRTVDMRWWRLLGFSVFLHDTSGDAFRALAGRYRAKCSEERDLAAFGGLFGE